MKLVVGLIAALALGIFSNTAKAQNQPGSYYSTNQGQPNFCANSSGADYGCVQNNAANSWQLGYGTSLTANGTAAATWDATPAFTANAPFVLTKTQIGTQVAGAAVASIWYSTQTIALTTSYEVLVTSGPGNVLVTATPSIATTTVVSGLTGLASGTYVVIESTGVQLITLQDNTALSGSRLKLYNSAPVVISSNSSASFIFDATDSFWHQIAR